MAKRYININFPFKNSNKGFLLDLTETDAAAIKADLMHLVLTNKGERLYLPDFGTNLRKYIFEPNDSLTESKVKTDISDTIDKYLPNLKVNNILIERETNSEYAATVLIDYTITDDVFEVNDTVRIQL